MTSHNEQMQFEELNFDEFEDSSKNLKQNKITGFHDLSSKIIIDAYDSLKNILFYSRFEFNKQYFLITLRLLK